jgi:hypothetical protein
MCLNFGREYQPVKLDGINFGRLCLLKGLKLLNGGCVSICMIFEESETYTTGAH